MQIHEDAEILTMLLRRDQSALNALSEKYGTLCLRMGESLLGSREDAEECFNDALLRLWERIPPDEPENLGGYLVTVCRRIMLDRRRHLQREKRGGGQSPAALDELVECIAAPEHPEEQYDSRALTEAINRFLDTLPADTRVMFVLRYWYCLPMQAVADELGSGVSRVKMALSRVRTKLKAYLEEEGYL